MHESRNIDENRPEKLHCSNTMNSNRKHLKRRPTIAFVTLLFFSLLEKVVPFSTPSLPWSGQGQIQMRQRGHDRFRMVSLEKSSEFTAFNGASNNNGKQIKSSRSGVLTPYQVLHPAFYSPTDSGNTRKLPLHACLEMLRKALECIANGEVNVADLLDDPMNQETQRPLREPALIRLEHTVSHPVDPLCWLHSQTRGGTRLSKDPILYFSNAEKNFETAVYGSAITHRGSSNSTLWELISNLPKDSHVYGGERFDDQSSSVGDEWKDFGSGMWILPAVELRTELHGQERKRGELDHGQEHDDTHQQSSTRPGGIPVSTIAVHLAPKEGETLQETARKTLDLFAQLSDSCSDAVPTTTLPPVISREYSYGPDMDGQELFERGVTKALDTFSDDAKEGLKKVVLARRMDIQFGPYAHLCGLDILRRWKFGGNEGGHLMYLFPGTSSDSEWSPSPTVREFFGCTPERLFQIKNGVVRSEALAGTRPRGSTQEADAALLRDLFTSPKDREENLITGRYIRRNFQELHKQGLLDDHESITGSNQETEGFFVRRLRHVQHICQRLEGGITKRTRASDVTQRLLKQLHPTPAVCGYPLQTAKEFIRINEAVGFDRGFYSGPFGFMGRDSADIVVAIRSGLLSKETSFDGETSTKLSVYAGAGIVPGSNVQSEWAETSFKLGVISSLFQPSPITLKSAPTPNVAWTTAFVEELIRCGVTQFYICPGSRSTPLVAAVAKAVRSNVGVVNALSVHDERAAGFRALGYGRGNSRPAAVITSSGTAVGNLYPSVMEAGMDGVPLLILTADRPYENRDTGANQALDQVKAFSSTYVRWFRDVPPPSDDVPVSVALSDADQAVTLSRKLRGPVHLNIQFRENLAPEGGAIRNDNRADSVTAFNGFRFTDAPGFRRWSIGGGRWLRSFSNINAVGPSVASTTVGGNDSVLEVANLIAKSKRGLIVVGNVRASVEEGETAENDSETSDIISNFAQTIGFPVMAGVQSGSLRRRSSAVIPFAEHLLKHPSISQNLDPDLIIQVGASLVSTEIQNLIVGSMKAREKMGDSTAALRNHILIHPHYPHERADPNFSLTHQISADIGPFLKAVEKQLESMGIDEGHYSSELCPLVMLGRALRDEIPAIINDASREVVTQQMAPDDASESEGSGTPALTEPQIVLALADAMSEIETMSLFLSNSMPVRNAEFFLYPLKEWDTLQNSTGSALSRVGVNRGASGIDGIISSASGFAEATDSPTTLLIGDLAALHDINAFHTLSTGKTSSHLSSHQRPSLTTVVVNNDGGGIFSFLPIAKHGNDVSFDEFFGTPTSAFSFERGVEAFGLPYRSTSDLESFASSYRLALESEEPCIVEAKVVGRDANVAVYGEITKRVSEFVDTKLSDATHKITAKHRKLPLKIYGGDMTEDSDGHLSTPALDGDRKEKILVLLHGWMGDKAEWDNVGPTLVQSIPPDWTIVSIDLPGHGDAPVLRSSHSQALASMLGLSSSAATDIEGDLSVDEMALAVLNSLSRDYGLQAIDALAGYSLGGRVALAMRRLSLWCDDVPSLIEEDTKMILLSSYPGDLRSSALDTTDDRSSSPPDAMLSRMAKDDTLSRSIIGRFNRERLLPASSAEKKSVWSGFVEKWYGVSALWGNLQKNNPSRYRAMISKRVETMSRRGCDMAAVLKQGSPSRHSSTDWQMVQPKKTLFVAGSLDAKYSELGRLWSIGADGVNYVEIPNAGHSLLVESPTKIGDAISDFLKSEEPARTPSATTSDSSGRVSPESLTADEEVSKVQRSKTAMSSELIGTEDVVPPTPLASQYDSTKLLGDIGSLDFELYEIDLTNSKREGVFGIGWGDKARMSEENRVDRRSGFILNVISRDGSAVGIGETSPLNGLHSETLKEAELQLKQIKSGLEKLEAKDLMVFDAKRLLAMDGALNEFIDSLTDKLLIDELVPSVRSGLEMALIALSSQVVRVPLLQAITENSPRVLESAKSPKSLPLNGLIMRGRSMGSSLEQREISYPSLKVKVGHQNAKEDALALSRALQETERRSDRRGKIRADANRAWGMSDADLFRAALDRLEVEAVAQMEFVEEPLKKHIVDDEWTFANQVRELEGWYERTHIPYALDETLADLADQHDHNFDSMAADIRNTITDETALNGCAAFVLKPALLGVELSLRLARMAHRELGIGAVFSCSFDSGVGLAYTAFLGAAADTSASETTLYAHGAGTFSMLGADTLSPPFSSYVDDQGVLNVASLSRAFYGLGLDELRESLVAELPGDKMVTVSQSSDQVDDFQSSAETSSSGREISVVGSLPLPFSDDVAASRFTDLPQMSRWSPWLNSVAYLDGRETEWTSNVRGVEFSWRAVSTILKKPHRGISWESVSGLKNMGVVEFIPTSEESCIMQVKMTIVTPRILAALFRGTSVFIEDFLQNKILKWSLEMFRDVVKGDLALERGDVELGDALFGAVEGRANAIEATLSYPGEDEIPTED